VPEGIEVDPEFGNPYNDIGAYLIEQGKHDEAIPWLERALRAARYESYHFPWFNLGRAYAAKDCYGRALECFRSHSRSSRSTPGERGPARRAPEDPLTPGEPPVANAFDVIIIGAGTGGYPAAIRAAQLGLKVAVVERQKTLGGTCLNWGCIPTKALLEHAHALKIAQASKEWGLILGDQPARIDMNQVQSRKDKIVTVLTRGVEFLFKKNGITWIRAVPACGPGTVEVTGDETQTLSAKEIVVATGSYARSVPGVEIDRTRIITSDEAIGMRTVPSSIAVLGSGPIGVEFATAFKRFGSDVTVIELLPHLVPLEDETISLELEKSFKKQGIAFHTSTTVTTAGRSRTASRSTRRWPTGRTGPSRPSTSWWRRAAAP